MNVCSAYKRDGEQFKRARETKNMELEKDEILKLDEILKFLNTERFKQYDILYLENYFKITREEYQFLYNHICTFYLNDEEIGDIKNKGTHYQTIECDYRTDRFIKSGGFEEYYKLKKERELETNKTTTVNIGKIVGRDNYENISTKSAKNLNINSNNPTTNNEIPNTKKESQTNSIILKFWKLISENKLISSVLVVIILWAIKEIFYIDLKN